MSVRLKGVRIFILVFLIVLCCTVFFQCSRQEVGQHVQVFDKKITKYVGSHYLLYLPKDYENNENEWPLMLYLHGGGATGVNVNRVKKNGPPKLIEEGREYPFIVVSPQHKKGTRFSNDFLKALIDEIVANYHVDEDRLYVTGLSGGGTATWNLAMEYTHRFAAIAPICGRGNPDGAHRIKHLPVWVFHGAKDKLRSVRTSEEMVTALKAVEGNVRFTVYPEAGHDAWTETYNNPEFYEWLLKQKRVRSENRSKESSK